EDGIRDLYVTGVQTCALPIYPDTAVANEAAAKVRRVHYLEAPVSGGEPMSAGTDGALNANVTFMAGGEAAAFEAAMPLMTILGKIGRASCRERGEIWVGAVGV